MDKRTGDVRPMEEIKKKPKEQRQNVSKPFRSGTTVDVDGLTWIVDRWKKGRLLLKRPAGATVLPSTLRGQVIGVLGMNMRVKTITPKKMFLDLVRENKYTEFRIPEIAPETREKITMMTDPSDTWYVYLNTADHTDIRFIQVGPLRTLSFPPKKYPQHKGETASLRNMIFIGTVDTETWEIVRMTWEEACR